MPIAPIRFGPLLADLDARGLRRRRRTVRQAGGAAADITLDGRPCVDFCSNDYLGLSTHPKLVEAFVAAARSQGVGARASHLISGHQDEHAALEREVAEWTGRELGFYKGEITGYFGSVTEAAVKAFHR